MAKKVYLTTKSGKAWRASLVPPKEGERSKVFETENGIAYDLQRTEEKGGGVAPKPLRVLTTRGEIQADVLAPARTAANNAQRFRKRVWSGKYGFEENIAKFRVHARHIPGLNELSGSGYKVGGHIELNGQAYPATWGGQPFGMVPAGANAYDSDPISMPAAPPNTMMYAFLYREYEVGGQPIYVFSQASNPQISGDASHNGAAGSVATGIGTPGPIATGGGWTSITNVLDVPFCIIGNTALGDAARVIIGASLEKRDRANWGDGANDAGGYARQGLNPSSGDKYPFISLARAAESAEQYLANSEFRSIYEELGTPMCGYGGNDFTYGRNANDALADILTIINRCKQKAGVDKAIYTRMAIKTNAAGNDWSQTSTQVVRPGFDAFRAIIDAGMAAAGISVFDPNPAYEEPGMPGIWKAGASPDGTHPLQAPHSDAGLLLKEFLSTF